MGDNLNYSAARQKLSQIVTGLAKDLNELRKKVKFHERVAPTTYRLKNGLDRLRAAIKPAGEAARTQLATACQRLRNEAKVLRSNSQTLWQKADLRGRMTPLFTRLEPTVRRYNDWMEMHWRRIAIEQRSAAVASFLIAVIALACSLPRPAYEVLVGDRPVGILKDARMVQSFVDRAITAKGLGGELKLQVTPAVTVRQVMWSKAYSAPDAIQQAIQQRVDVVADASVIMVNGKASIPVASTAVANSVLDQVKKAYVDKHPGVQSAKGEFMEQVSVEKQLIPLDQLKAPEQAIRLLLEGTERQELITVSRGDSLWTIAGQRQITVDELKKANPNVNESNLQEGQTLKLIVAEPLVNVVTSEVVQVEEPIAFGTDVTYSDELFTWEQNVKRDGTPGSRAVIYEVTKNNGQEVKRTETGEKIVAQPINKLIVKGTKVAPNRGTGDFAWPLRSGYISSGYGYREEGFHSGVDIAAPTGTPAYAADSGVVSFAGWDSGGLGYMVAIDHKNGMVSRYGHLSAILVDVGQGVTKGEQVGRVGSTGYSTGAHLHFEILTSGRRVNPMNYFD